MHWFVYLSILIVGVVMFRYLMQARIEQIYSDQFLRNKLQYEMDQDICNIYQDSRFKSTFSPYGFLSITSSMLTGQIGKNWMDDNSNFINSLENMMRFLAIIKGFKYMLDIDASLFFNTVNPQIKRKTFIALLKISNDFQNQKITFIKISIIDQVLFIDIDDNFTNPKSISIQ